MDLPDDLLKWWRLADGVQPDAGIAGSVIPPFYNPWPVLDALDSRRSWLEQWGNASDLALADGRPDPALAPAGTPCYLGWLPVWVPIAYDGFGDDLFVDLRSGPLHGCVMEFDHVNCASRGPNWPNIRVMLAEIAKALEHGTPIGLGPVRVQLLEEGRLRWSDEQPV